jgi:hypothetical protein
MKKTLKISAVALLAVALALNIQNSVFDYYGLKDSNLCNMIWRQTNADLNGTLDGTGGEATEVDTGTGEAGMELRWTINDSTVSCADQTVNITFNQTSSNKYSAAVSGGTWIGTWSAALDLGTLFAGNQGSGTLTGYVITFPKNSNGTPMTFAKRQCLSGGFDRCQSLDPCLQMIGKAVEDAIRYH